MFFVKDCSRLSLMSNVIILINIFAVINVVAVPGQSNGSTSLTLESPNAPTNLQGSLLSYVKNPKYPAYCPRRRVGLEISFKAKEASASSQRTDNEIGDNKQPAAQVLTARMGADYHVTCRYGGTIVYTVKWAAKYHLGQRRMTYENVDKVTAFSPYPDLQGNSWPRFYSNFWYSTACFSTGRLECRYLFMGRFMGEIWPGYMSMHLVTDDHLHDSWAPEALETCRVKELFPGGPPGNPRPSACVIRDIHVYDLED